jgi:hypothetical protein
MAAATTGVTPTDLRKVRLEKFGPDADASAVAEREPSPAGRERVCSDTSTSLLSEPERAVDGLAYHHGIQNSEFRIQN